MRVRFGEWNLIDENGREIMVEPNELLQCCYESSYKSIRVRDIIQEGIKRYINAGFIAKDYSQSPLYIFLEAAICFDEKYLSIKADQMEKDSLIKDKKEKSKKGAYYIDGKRIKKANSYRPYSFFIE